MTSALALFLGLSSHLLIQLCELGHTTLNIRGSSTQRTGIQAIKRTLRGLSVEVLRDDIMRIAICFDDALLKPGRSRTVLTEKLHAV